MPSALKYAVVSVGFTALIWLSSCGSQQPGSAAPEIHKGDRLTSFSQEITSPIHEFQVKAGGAYEVDISAKNTGTQPWFGGGDAMSVDVGYRWLDSNGSVLPMEGKRTQLDRAAVQPGESDQLKVQVVAPSKPGSYMVWISMVQEGVVWFYAQGAKPLVLQVTVD
ncbi:MAG TPA: hypothetical protein VHZ55_29010 [Bryobacteraceae bacterium]|jgi:hypothetical protein|nr:hypothetical protein [Bryobacteraceae bacterium]